jgi:cytochrome c553
MSLHIRDHECMIGAIRLALISLIALLGVILNTGTGEAFHTGAVAECKECHPGWTRELRGSDASSTCLRCHQAPAGFRIPAGAYVATADSDMPSGVPPSQMTPGGDFGYLKKNYTWKVSSYQQRASPGERHGHNIVALDYGFAADTTYATTPDGVYPASELSCISCHNPHGRIVQSNGTPGSYRLLGGIGYKSSSAPDMVFTVDPPVAVAPRDYNRSEAVTETRVAYGKGMSEWCSNCHTRSGTGYGHSAGAGARFTPTIISNYNAYVKSGDLSGKDSESYTSIVPFEEGTDDLQILSQHAKNDGSSLNGPDANAVVMCLTCHRAHASAWDSIMRWNVAVEFIVHNSMYPGINNGSLAEYAQGRTAAETQRAFYDRPVSRFASYQRSLCNKCHARD